MDGGEQFVSEAIEPLAGRFDPTAMSRGEPGAPAGFTWRGVAYRVAHVEQTWKTSTPERGELYLRRHWFRVRCASGETMTLYCQRQAANRNKPKARWWLYSLSPARGDARDRGGSTAP